MAPQDLGDVAAVSGTRTTKTVVLVPWRGGDELRELNRETTWPYLEALGYPIVEGDREGPWSRGAALNAAARDAGDWDFALLADADTIPDPDAIEHALKLADETGGAVRPHDHLKRLTPSGSLVFARGGELEPRHVETEFPGGGLSVVARSGWDKVGGFDERFVGWGYEDSVFNIRMLAVADWNRVPGTVLHLFHPTDWKKTPEVRANRQLLMRERIKYRRLIEEASARKQLNLGTIL